MTLAVARATLDHLESVAPLFDAYRRFYGQAADLDGARRFLRERLERGESALFLAIWESETETTPTAVGFAQLYPLFTSVGMKRVWLLNDLYVAEAARRRGAAKKLMEAAREFAIKDGASKLLLETASDNAAAKALYESLGWQVERGFDHYALTLPVFADYWGA
jgi:ribosomal protein S18 acetylase RimI-like enzyme